MGDLKNPRLIWAKGILFLVLGCISATLLLIRSSDLQVALLLVVSIWAFCRAYYFAFYVIQHYVDPTYNFAGLLSFVRYVVSKDEKTQ